MPEQRKFGWLEFLLALAVLVVVALLMLRLFRPEWLPNFVPEGPGGTALMVVAAGTIAWLSARRAADRQRSLYERMGEGFQAIIYFIFFVLIVYLFFVEQD